MGIVKSIVESENFKMTWLKGAGFTFEPLDMEKFEKMEIDGHLYYAISDYALQSEKLMGFIEKEVIKDNKPVKIMCLDCVTATNVMVESDNVLLDLEDKIFIPYEISYAKLMGVY